MEHEHTSPGQSQFPHEPLALPHFDEEATLQSARPVVPLHEVKMADRSKRRLLMGVALIGAVIVGALTASLIYSHGAWWAEPSASASVENSSQSEADNLLMPSGEATGSAVDSSELAPSDTESDEIAVTKGKVKITTRNSAAIKKQTVQRPQARKPTAKAVSESEERDDHVAADQVENSHDHRRDERRLRRERRVNRPRTDDGLTRIREIFEGPPRP